MMGLSDVPWPAASVLEMERRAQRDALLSTTHQTATDIAAPRQMDYAPTIRLLAVWLTVTPVLMLEIRTQRDTLPSATRQTATAIAAPRQGKESPTMRLNTMP